MTEASDSRDPGETLHPITRQMLVSSLWLVKVRWIAVGALVLGGIFATVAGYHISQPAILTLALYLLVANCVFTLVGLRIKESESSRRQLRVFNNIQIIADWVAVIVLVYFTGSITSPFLFFFFFHLVMAAILTPVARFYFNAIVAVVLINTMFLVEYSGLLPHQQLFEGSLAAHLWQPRYMIAYQGALSLSVFFTAYFSSWVSELWRRRVGELFDTKSRLEDATRRMHSIYEVLRLVGVNFEMDDLLAHLTREATRLWELNASLIAVFEQDSRRIGFVAAHGIDEGDRPDLLRLFDDPAFNGEVEKGHPFLFREPGRGGDASPAQKAPADARERSLMVVPLRVGASMIGVCVFISQSPSRFPQEDNLYFQIFCDLIAIDIENTRIRRSLRSHDLERSRFYHRVAHELRAPLAAALTTLVVIAEGYVTEPARLKELVQKVGLRLESLNETLNELLLLAQDQGAAVQKTLEEVEIGAVVRSSADFFDALARKKGIVLSLEIEAGVPTVLSTCTSLDRVCSNLISNAIKYTLPGGEVRITLARSGDRRIRLAVTDTGIGIPADAQDKLFTEFYRAPNAKELGEVGTGLGLNITKKLVEECGGQIAFESAEGRGTTFTITLPAAGPSAAPG
jgi:signal transduction histidine kinase